MEHEQRAVQPPITRHTREYLQASILGGNVGARRASDAVVIAFCLTTACQQQARLLIGAHHATLFGEARAGGVGCGS